MMEKRLAWEGGDFVTVNVTGSRSNRRPIFGSQNTRPVKRAISCASAADGRRLPDILENAPPRAR